MLNKYINDEKIHIVAPPGAGKTILALELLLRIGNKSLILVPTIAIKEQWIERLKKDFINGDKEGLISSEIENPKIITIDTYQALYALKRKGIEVNKIITKNNIKTIIFSKTTIEQEIFSDEITQIKKELVKLGCIDDSDKTKLFINNNENKIEYGLKNSSTYEQMIFLKNMEQAIDISSDSRYIVIFYDKACSVPEIFAKNNVDAKLFFEKLKIPNKKLIYTKTEIGKDILLEYKLHGLNDFKY